MCPILEEVYIEGWIEGWIEVWEVWHEVWPEGEYVDKRKMAQMITKALIEGNRVSEESIAKVVGEWLAQSEEQD